MQAAPAAAPALPATPTARPQQPTAQVHMETGSEEERELERMKAELAA